MNVAVEKLSFQDAAFLRMESEARPFHVGGLMLLTQPELLPKGFYRKLARHCGRLNELWPIFNKKLRNPDSLRSPCWVPALDYDPADHVHHYALPSPGRMDDLLGMISRVHERMLDRHRPLWEIHLVEGLPGNRFALYCKVHHALVDGVGALRMLDALFSPSPDAGIDFRQARPRAKKHHARHGALRQLGAIRGELKKHYAALPQMSGLLTGMSLDAIMGKRDVPPLPFTAPRTLFNTDVDKRRRIVIGELPVNGMHRLGERYGATVNDVLLAVCGGALRSYLQTQNALPADSLEAGVPMSIKAGQSAGNQVSFIICPLYTNESRPLTRLKRIVRVMNKAKSNMHSMSRTAAQDFTNMLMMPSILLTLSGRASQVKPALNVIVSNVPGSRQRLYLDGARLEAIYPLSVVTDGLGINITVVSYLSKLCVAVTSCPTEQPGIEALGKHLRDSYRALAEAAG
ncbi:MAG: wax ester/triacylglycerol synthase family O-acyltransferase [Pseudomonadota bacterium]